MEASCDIARTLVFYVLLRPVSRGLALLAAFFGLVGTAVFAGAQLFFYAPLLVLGGSSYLKTFSPDQLNALAMLSVRLFVAGAGLFTVLYGVAWVVRGYLIYRSGYLPRFIGVLVTVGDFGFIVRNFLLVLAPAYATNLFLDAVSGRTGTDAVVVRAGD